QQIRPRRQQEPHQQRAGLTAAASHGSIVARRPVLRRQLAGRDAPVRDRKSTRLNSSHVSISYAVFCLKKKTHSLAGERIILSTFSKSTNLGLFHLTI